MGIRRRPRTGIIALASAALMVLAACGTGEQGDAAGSPVDSVTSEVEEWSAPRPITVTQTPLLSDSTLPIAGDLGWFEEAGIDVIVVEGRSTSQLTPLLIAEEVDVLYGAISPAIATAIAGGSGIRLVAAGQVMDPQACPTYALLMLPDAGPRIDPDDPVALRELRVGGPFESGYLGLWFLEELGARSGITLDDMNLVNVTTADAAATLAAGGVDALLATEPALTRIQQDFGAEIVARVDEVLPGKLLTGLFFGPKLLADPELAARYLAVHLRAVAEHAKGATERNVTVMAGTTGLPPELLEAVCWETMDAGSTPHVGAVTEAFDAAVRFGTLDVVPAEEQVWDHSVGLRARELLVEWGVRLGG